MMPPAAPQLRIARPVGDLARAVAMYRAGLGWHVLGSFVDHAGFDGVMLGLAGAPYHLEFTRCRHHPVAPTPTAEDLLVLYLPIEAEWQAGAARLLAAGFSAVTAFNPYSDHHGRTYVDADGYRVVLQHGAWPGPDTPRP